MFLGIALAIAGLVVGFGGNTALNKKKLNSAENDVKKEIDKSKKERDKIISEARTEADAILDGAKKDEAQRRKEVKEIEQRLLNRDEQIDKKLDDLDRRTDSLRKAEDEVDELKDEIRKIRETQQEKLEKIAHLTKQEAAEKLTAMTEKDIKNDLVGLINKLQVEAKETAEDQAGFIIVSAMERMASEVTAERTVTTVKLEDEDMKGRIIGKEGRNIQALQRATGVDIMVDDSPGVIVLSSFDPIRREVARQTLEMLIKDGRIQPAKIEELVDKAQKNVQKEVVLAGENAA